MKQILFFFLLLLIFPSFVLAATLKTEWDEYTEEADGFRIYRVTGEQSAVVVWETDDISLTGAQFEYDESLGCGTFYIVAYRGAAESLPSDTALWCPENQIPPMQVRPGQVIKFTIEVIE